MAERYDFYVHDNRKITFNLTEPIMREDSGVTDFVFHIPKVLNELEVSDWQWWLVFVNAKKEKYSIALTLSDDPESPLEKNVGTYTVDYAMSIKAGSVQFALEAINTGTGGAIDNEWHTLTYETKVKETLQGNQTEYAETESDIISELLIEVRNKVNQLVGGATPEPKSLIADMTDTKKVYLYVGSETGESTDYWYYYNGSAWVPGGLYSAGIVDAVPTQGSTNAVSSGGVYSALERITETSVNILDESALSSASGISRDQNGYYYGTVKNWVAAFSNLLPVGEEFEENTRYTISGNYHFDNVGAFSGTVLSVKCRYTNDTTSTLIGFSASNTSDIAFAVTTSAAKSVGHLFMPLVDYKGNDYILYLKDVQIEKGDSASGYVPHVTACDFIARRLIADNVSAINENATEIANNAIAIEEKDSEISLLFNMCRNDSAFAWEFGSVSSTGSFIENLSKLRTAESHLLNADTIIEADEGFTYRLYYYTHNVNSSMDSATASGYYSGTSGWKTGKFKVASDVIAVICMQRSDETVQDGDYSHIAIKQGVGINALDDSITERIINAVRVSDSNDVNFAWEFGYVNISTGAMQDSVEGIRTGFHYLKSGTKIYCDEGYKYRLYRYTSPNVSAFEQYYGQDYDTTLHYITGLFELDSDGYYYIALKRISGNIVDISEASNIHIMPNTALNAFEDAMSFGVLPYNRIGLDNYIDNLINLNADLVLHIITDIHSGYPDTYPVINYLANAGVGNYFFELGDVIKSTFPTKDEAVTYLRQSFRTMGYTRTNTPIIMLQGNHDTNPLSGTDTSKNVTQENFYNLSMARTKATKQPVNKAYGYVDVESTKVRIIYLNTSDIYDANTGSALVTGQYTMIQQGQVDWLQNVALNFTDKDAPSDWAVIIVTHDSLSQIQRPMFEALFTAFKNGTAVSGNYNVTVSSYSYTLMLNADFSTQGGIDVICEVNGHHHKDMIRELGTSGIQQVYVACEGPASASYDSNGETVYYERVRGTTDEHLIDTLVLDKANRKVYFKRFGVGVDREISY